MLRERVVHPRVKVTLLADLTLAAASIVPFTLSIAVAATIDPYFAFSSPPPLCQQTLFRDCFARLSYSRSQTFLPSFLPFDALLVEHPSSPFIFLGQGCSPVDLRSLDQLSLFFSLLTRSCFEKRHLSLLASRYSDGFSIESRNINRIDIKRQPWLILTIAEKRLRRVGGALVPGL